VSEPIRDPSVSLRLARAFDLASGRVVFDIDETVKPVVVVDTLARNDPRFGTPDRVFSFGATNTPAATDHALMRLRMLKVERVVRIRRVIVAVTAATDVLVGVTTAPPMVGGGTLRVGGAWSRTKRELADVEIASGSVTPANLPVMDDDNLARMRLGSASLVWTMDLDVTFDADSNPGAFVVFSAAINVPLSCTLVWEEFDRG